MKRNAPSAAHRSAADLLQRAGTDDASETSPNTPSHPPAPWSGSIRAYAWLLVIVGTILLGAAVELALDKTIAGQ